MSLARRLFTSLTFGALAMGTLKGCIFSRAEIAFSVTVPEVVRADARWIEVAAYPERCPTAEQLSGPLPNEGLQARVAMAVGDKNPPAFGRLPKGTYGFAASIRNSQCGVLAAGCTVAKLPSDSSVDIQVAPLFSSAGTCADGIACAYAQCVPAVNSGDLSAGRGCSMRLVGAGPLGAPLSDDVVISSPSIVATNDGFLIAYREYLPQMGQAKLTLVPVDQGGGIRTLHEYALADRCAGLEETDGVSLAFSAQEERGLLAVGRRPCPGTVGGLDLFAIEKDGSASRSSFTESPSGTITLSPHSLALATASKYVIAFGFDTYARVADVDAAKLAFASSSPATVFATSATSALVARSPSALALLATIPTSAADAGADAKADAAPQEARIALTFASAATSFDKLPKAVTNTGKFGSLALQEGRLFVVRQSVIPGRAAEYDAYDLGSTTAVATDSISTTVATGETTAIDIALAQNRAFFAVGQPKSVTLLVYDHATTHPTYLREVHLPSDPRIPTFVGQFRDGSVAVTATDSRVAVAWTTGKTLQKNDVLGGYAVFACTNP
jgi:hypothetical protein